MSKKKVLVVLDSMYIRGIEKAALRFQDGLDKEKFEFTYLVRLRFNGPLEHEAIGKGSRIIHMPYAPKQIFKVMAYLKQLFTEEKYDIVHCHSTFYNGLILKVAYDCGITKRISHSHLTRDKENPVYVLMMQKILNKYATDILACGTDAGKDLYGATEFDKRGKVLDNPVDTKSYKYNQEMRNFIRSTVGVSESTMVWGHVGRFSPIKNHMFLLEIFAEWVKKHPDSVLMLVGDGAERGNIIRKVQELGLNRKVCFTGNRMDVNRLLMAMDLMVFPSLREGFPVTLIEAQATKLPCLISDTVTKETKLNENVEFVSLEDSKDTWIETAEKLLGYNRVEISEAEVERRFGISTVGKKLEEIYLENLE